MRKLFLVMALAAASTMAGTSYASAQEQKQEVKKEVNQEESKTFKMRSRVVADSIRQKGTRWGKKVAEGTAVAVDSVGSKGERLGRKAKVKADTLGRRSKRAWKVLRGEDQQK